MTNVQRGRLIVIGIIVTTLVTDAVIIGFSLAFRGLDPFATQIVRFSLTSLLMWGLYRGNGVARWIAIVLFGLAGLMGLSNVLQNDLVAAVVGGTMGIVLLTVAGILLISKSVEAFREHQQGR